ncbi:ceramidase domain-containing protein [Legionella parisiensis]|uniref:ceramidase domain-containing protein n=1 Tax=Legionella parisiensis TaxID=45071 RepID=UPI0007308088|nr:ceramidase domain-containing protein [Legionella parisiensis]
MIKNNFQDKIIAFLLIFTVVTTLVISLIPPIVQPLNYHDFANKHTLFFISNFSDVMSNLAFIFAGYLGLKTIYRPSKAQCELIPEAKWAYLLGFIGTILTGLGSAYYHLHPNNVTLFWDRVPMGILLMSFFSAIFIERVHRSIGFYLLSPLIVIATLCTLYWELSERWGQGDMRLYIWSQGYPLIMIIFILLFFPTSYNRNYFLAISLILFGLAKLTEALDKMIYYLTSKSISGHTLKHLLAAAAVYTLVYYVKYRQSKNIYYYT